MSSERPLLTFQDVRTQLKRDYTKDGLQVPLGINAGGRMHFECLEKHSASAHMLLCGRSCSGKLTTLQFILKALYSMYKEDLRVSYIDGSGDGAYIFQNISYTIDRPTVPYIMATVDNSDSLDYLLRAVLSIVEAKIDTKPEVIVLNKLDCFLEETSEHYAGVLSALGEMGRSKNVHVIYVTSMGAYTDRPLGGYVSFSLKCATRLTKEESNKMFGCDWASIEGGSEKYGNLTYKYNDTLMRVAVPSVL